MNKNVVVDIDGVLADFISAFQKKFGNDKPELESLEARYPNKNLLICKFVEDPSTYSRLEPVSLGLSIVEYLNDQGFDVNIITNRPAFSQWITRRWLDRYKIKYLSFGVYPNKITRIKEINPICAVDDLISVSRGLEPYNVPVLLLSNPWNWYYEHKNRIFSNINEFIIKFNEILQEKDIK